MKDLRKAAEAVLEAWGWDWSEPRNEALKERMEALRQALAKPEWIGLTDEESIKLLQKAAKHKSPDYCTAPEMAVEFGRLASEALEEKNGGQES